MSTRAIAAFTLAATISVALVQPAASAPITSSVPAIPAATAAKVAAQQVGTCQRDTAADLRWVSWIYRVHTGADPSMEAGARWLADIAGGRDYRSIARAIAAAPAPAAATVGHLYRTLIGRTPSTAEVNGWTSTLQAHGSAHVARSFLASGEVYAKAGSTDARWLDHVYSLVLDRSPDAVGQRYWLDRLAGGTSRQQVAGALWDAPQSVSRRVDASYRKVFGRAGDAGGIAYWSGIASTEGDEALDAALVATQAGWDRAQATYGAAASPMPAPCPPRARWVPPPGSIVRSLPALPGRSRRLATLTFDDGPHPTWTPQILEVLARYDVPATFFVVGNQANRHPDLVRRMLAEGHRLAVHTVSHPNLLTLGGDGQRREIAGSVDIVNRIVGPGQVRCFRPPYGNRNATTDRIATDLGLATIMWSRDGRDWASPGVDHIVNANLDTRYDDGRAVLLLHDGGLQRAQTVAALPRLIEALRAQGYEFVQIC